MYQNVSSSRGGVEASRSLSQLELRLERALEIVRVSARVMAEMSRDVELAEAS